MPSLPTKLSTRPWAAQENPIYACSLYVATLSCCSFNGLSGFKRRMWKFKSQFSISNYEYPVTGICVIYYHSR